MISIIITTKKEPKTLPRAIEAILKETQINTNGNTNQHKWEIIVVGPDKETEEIAKKYSEIKYIKDKGRGKPAALNLAFYQAQGEILVLTDGDVWIKEDSIKKILKHFEDDSELCRSQGCYAKVGAVSGHPVSINCQKTMFGYWAKFLTDAADWTRRKKSARGEYLMCTGYLYAFRNIIKEVPCETLIEDAVISQMIWQNSHKIVYEPEAIVYVKFPTNIFDWVKQKIRSTGGFVQKINTPNDKLIMKKDRMRGFDQEIKGGLNLFFSHPQNIREFLWLILLYLARLYLWFLILIRVKIFKKYSWPRVESTKEH